MKVIKPAHALLGLPILGLLWCLLSGRFDRQVNSNEGSTQTASGEMVRVLPPETLNSNKRHENTVTRLDSNVDDGTLLEEPFSDFVITFVGEESDAGGLAGAFVSQIKGMVNVPILLDEKFSGATFRLDTGNYKVELEKGWTAVPTFVGPNSLHTVRVFSPRSVSFSIQYLKQPLVNTNVFVDFPESLFSWEGQSDEAGVVSLPKAPSTSASIFLESNEFIYAWQFSEGLGIKDREIGLSIEKLLPEKTLTISNKETGLPIPNARVLWNEDKLVGLESDQNGEITIPRRGGAIGYVSIVAPGFLPDIFSLSTGEEKIQLDPAKYASVQVNGIDGEPVSGATVTVFSESKFDYEAVLVKTFEVLTGANGRCVVTAPLEGQVLITARKSEIGSASLTLGVRGEEKGITITLKRPLALNVTLESQSILESLSVSTESLNDEVVPWELASPGTVHFPDVSMLKSFKILDNGIGLVEIRRSRKWGTILAGTSQGAGTALGGSLKVNLEPTIEVSGKIVDSEGTPLPWQTFQLRIMRHDERIANIGLFPNFEGHIPTPLAGWVRYKGPTVFPIMSNELGRFNALGIPPGLYQIEFPSPNKTHYTLPIGVDKESYFVNLPAWGDVVVTKPDDIFLDLEVRDNETDLRVPECSLEVTYSSFAESGKVTRLSYLDGRIARWLSLTPGAQVRVTARGFYSSQILSFAEFRNTPTSKIYLERMERMDLSFDEAILKNGRGVRLRFFRPIPYSGRLQQIFSESHSVPESGVLSFSAPFENCIVSITPGSGRGNGFQTNQFPFIPGGREEILPLGEGENF